MVALTAMMMIVRRRFELGILRRASPCSRSYSTSSSSKKVPILYTDESDSGITYELLSWGRGASGQLGGGIEEVRIYPSPVASLHVNPASFRLSPVPGRLPGSSVEGAAESPAAVEVGVSCGLFHSGLLVDGRLWIWGKGDGGRLGFGHETAAFLPTLNPNLSPVKSVALGGVHSIALDTLGDVFSWGYGGFGALGHCVYTRELLPRLVEGPWEGRRKHIATSGTHTAAITGSGELYMWGRDEGDGRLGLGPRPGPNEGGGMSIPSQVKALPVPVASAYCGGFFTMALTEEGQVWNWGANANYELGRGNKIGGWKPQPIPNLTDVRVIQVASGGYHSLALTDDGKVLSWGHGGQGQLGHSNIQSQQVPTVIDSLADQRIIYIACGGASSAAVTDDGKLYMWGNAKDSQLGTPGLPEINTQPIRVKFLVEEDDELGSHHVIAIAVGASHALCLVSRSGLRKATSFEA